MELLPSGRKEKRGLKECCERVNVSVSDGLTPGQEGTHREQGGVIEKTPHVYQSLRIELVNHDQEGRKVENKKN